MEKETILEYIKQNTTADIPKIQNEFSLSYKEAKTVVDQLTADNSIIFTSGIEYSYNKEKFDALEEEKKSAEKRKRTTPFDSYFPYIKHDNDDDDDDDEDDDDDDDDFSLKLHFNPYDEAFNRETFFPVRPRSSITSGIYDDIEDKYKSFAEKKLEQMIIENPKFGKKKILAKAKSLLEELLQARIPNSGDEIKMFETVVEMLEEMSSHKFSKIKKKLLID